MKVFFSVGEPSGDLHTARLIQELKRLDPDLDTTGLGGPKMREAGCRLHYQLTDLAIVGLFRVLPALGTFYRVFQLAKAALKSERPDVVVLVDFPGFNWHIAAAAKTLGIPVVYYLPPQLWAWAPWRIQKVRRTIDLVLCALPFEFDWYQSRGVRAVFVGSPFFDDVAEHEHDPVVSTTLARQAADGDRLIAVLPGSRRHEVLNNFPIQIDVLRLLARDVPDTRFLIANLHEKHRALCAELLAKEPPLPEGTRVDFFVGKTSEILSAGEVVLMKSGSVSLEVMARQKPAVVVYKITWALRILRTMFVTCRYITLPNLIAGREVIPEYTPVHRGPGVAQALANHLKTWLTQPLERARMAGELRALHAATHVAGASRAAATEIFRLVSSRAGTPLPAGVGPNVTPVPLNSNRSAA